MATTSSSAEITDEPEAGQLVRHEGKTFTTVQEGRAYILVPPNAQTSVDPQAKSQAKSKAENGSHMQNVFYNPIQQFNRDLSVLAIKAFGEDRCRRKSQKHQEELERNRRKNERKRKREGAKQDGGSVKVRRSEDGSSATAPSSDALSSSGAQQSLPGLAQEATGVENVEQGNHAANEINGVRDGGHSDSPDPHTQSNTPTSSNRRSTTANGQSKDPHEWKPNFRILDALSATGLRALRYAAEIPFATSVVANDREKKAVANIEINVRHNKLDSLITPTTGDALGLMYSAAFPPPDSHGPNHVGRRYDVIDLDPYGTAAPFFDAALQALEDGGMLCVTCTDSGVFASCGYSEKTYSLYGGLPIKGIHSHEGGLRLILHSIATTASKYGIAIEPLLSLSIDFYVRLFIRVRKSPLDVKFLAGKSMLVYGCDHGCGAWTTQFLGRHTHYKESDTVWKYSIAQAPSANEHCEHCGSKTHVAGPMWGGPLHNPVFIENILDDLKDVSQEIYQTKPRIEGMLTTALDELTVNSDTMDFRSTTTAAKDGSKDILPHTPPEAIDRHPFFFIPSALCKVIRAQAPSEILLKGALRHAGYRVTRSHCKPGSIKTDAPWTAIWEVMREWVRQRSPIKEGALQEGQAGWKIMQDARRVDGDGDGESNSAARDTEGAEAHSNGAVNGNNGTSTAESTPDYFLDTPEPTVPRVPPTNPKRMEVFFDEKLGKDKPGKRLVRYQENPKENWGPMRKAKGRA